MSLQKEEEKKEATGWGDDISGSSSVRRKCNDNTSDEEDDDEEELGDLPPSVADSIGECFDSEEALEAALVKAGVGDLPVVLVDGKPRLVMPSDQHNAFTLRYQMHFAIWAKNKWGCSSASSKVHLQNRRSRDPDLSYWGYPRCSYYSDGALLPADEHIGSVPDVVIQFSWKNKAKYEEDAIDDLMNRAVEEYRGGVSTRPNVGYLIKIRFSKKRTLQGGSKTQDVEGLDIYRLSHGTTIADARNSTNPNATHVRYFPNGPEYYITITPGDLGITGFWAILCGHYMIKASEIFERMRQVQQLRQARGFAT